jgi:hypothetical protein
MPSITARELLACSWDGMSIEPVHVCVSNPEYASRRKLLKKSHFLGPVFVF